MKTIKIFLSIAGFALTGICFGQLLTNSESDVLYYTEHRLNESPPRISSGIQLETPIMIRSYTVPIESDMVIEDWMTAPFEANYYEEELEIESWMKTPFESNFYEEKIEIESWMCAPFN